MTQKNPYLIENKKPVETVYELKNETQGVVGNQIPSFEEFANAYEYDEKIANSYYLENQTQEKGYGPVLKDGDGSYYYYRSSGDKFANKYSLESPIKVYPSPPKVSNKCDYCGRNVCVSEVCREKQIRDAIRIWKWIGKTAIAISGGWFLDAEIAIKVGGLLWGTTKVVKNCTDNESFKEVLEFIGDIGWDTAKGGFYGELIGIGSKTLASKTTKEIGHLVAKAIAVNGGKVAGDVKELIKIGRMISLCQKGHELKEKYEKYGGKVFCEIARHEYHKDCGKSYDSDCEICNP